MTFAPSNAQSSYLPVDFDLPREQNGLHDFVNKRERLTSTILNIKENGTYENSELLSAQQWFSTQAAGTTKQTRYAFRKVIDFGTLPNNATKSVAHGLTLDDTVNPSTYFFTEINGTAYDTTTGGEKAIAINGTYYDIAAGAIANPINLYVDQTNVNITTTSNRTNFTRCYVTLNYIKNF